MWILAHRCPPPPIGNADQNCAPIICFADFFSCSVRHSYWRRVRRCAIILADCKEDERVLCASPIFKPIAYKLSISNRRRKYVEEKTATLKFKQSSIATVLNHPLTVARFPIPLIFRYPLPLSYHYVCVSASGGQISTKHLTTSIRPFFATCRLPNTLSFGGVSNQAYFFWGRTVNDR